MLLVWGLGKTIDSVELPPSFFFNDTASTEIYPLSLHDALPILPPFCAPMLPSLIQPVPFTVIVPEVKPSQFAGAPARTPLTLAIRTPPCASTIPLAPLPVKYPPGVRTELLLLTTTLLLFPNTPA